MLLLRPALLLLLLAGLRSAHGQADVKLVAEGDSLMELGRVQKASDRYTQAIALAPKAAYYTARARAWYALDRMDRMLLDCEAALKLDSLHPGANLLRAQYAYRSEDHPTTVRRATMALEHGAQGDQRRLALLLRGQARAELKDHRAAVEDLREGLGTRTDELDAMRALARSLDALGDHAASLTVLEQLCAVQPEDIGNWTNRGYELAALGRFDEALTNYGEALALDKDEPTVLSNRAWALLKLGRQDEALSDVERSLKSYPANPYALRTRALLYVAKGQREKACADLELARIIGGVDDVLQLITEHCAGIAPKR